VAAPLPPFRYSHEVVSVFSGAYTNVANTDFTPNWGQSTIVTFPQIQGDSVMRFGNFNYQGNQFATPLNLSAMDTLHLDMWTANATTVNIYLISTGPVETPYSLPITPNQWVSHDIPLSTFSAVNLADVIQLKYDGGTGSQTFFIDNLYFYRESVVGQEELTTAAPSVSIYPNPASIGEAIHLEGNVVEYEVLDLSGKQVLRGQSEVIPSTSLNPGMYILRLTTAENNVVARKVVVRK
jgi:hypothetical protein